MSSSQDMIEIDRYHHKKCSFSGCENISTDKNVHFFKFPVTRPTQCKQWVKNSCNEALTSLPLKALGERKVCGDHFTENSYTSTLKRYLCKFAVPTIVKPNKNTKHRKSKSLKKKAVSSTSQTKSKTIDGNVKTVALHQDGSSNDRYKRQRRKITTAKTPVPSKQQLRTDLQNQQKTRSKYKNQLQRLKCKKPKELTKEDVMKYIETRLPEKITKFIANQLELSESTKKRKSVNKVQRDSLPMYLPSLLVDVQLGDNTQKDEQSQILPEEAPSSSIQGSKGKKRTLESENPSTSSATKSQPMETDEGATSEIAKAVQLEKTPNTKEPSHMIAESATNREEDAMMADHLPSDSINPFPFNMVVIKEEPGDFETEYFPVKQEEEIDIFDVEGTNSNVNQDNLHENLSFDVPIKKENPEGDTILTNRNSSEKGCQVSLLNNDVGFLNLQVLPGSVKSIKIPGIPLNTTMANSSSIISSLNSNMLSEKLPLAMRVQVDASTASSQKVSTSLTGVNVSTAANSLANFKPNKSLASKNKRMPPRIESISKPILVPFKDSLMNSVPETDPPNILTLLETPSQIQINSTGDDLPKQILDNLKSVLNIPNPDTSLTNTVIVTEKPKVSTPAEPTSKHILVPLNTAISTPETVSNTLSTGNTVQTAVLGNTLLSFQTVARPEKPKVAKPSKSKPIKEKPKTIEYMVPKDEHDLFGIMLARSLRNMKHQKYRDKLMRIVRNAIKGIGKEDNNESKISQEQAVLGLSSSLSTD